MTFPGVVRDYLVVRKYLAPRRTVSETAPDIFSLWSCRSHLAMVFAYLDPNIGTVVVQTVVAAAITVPIILRTQVSALLSRLRGQKAAPPATDPDEVQSRD